MGVCVYIFVCMSSVLRGHTHTYTHTHTQRHTHYAHSCSVILNNKCPVVDVAVAAAVDLRLRVAASSTLDVFHENKIIFTNPLAVFLFWSPSLPLSLFYGVSAPALVVSLRCFQRVP